MPEHKVKIISEFKKKGPTAMIGDGLNDVPALAAARAIGGCAVYVSDKPGNHDFKILKKLVLPDGSVLRARYAGRPTQDCLFDDTVMDGKSLLKIWNLNILTGVVGVFNCQGAGNWPLKSSEATLSHITILGKVRPIDVEFLEEVASENWNGVCAVYAFNTGLLSKVFGYDVQFASIGLLDMYNSGGAVDALDCTMDVEIPEEDLEISFSRTGGKGGQHVNKVETAVRITHIPTGVTVRCTEERSQLANKIKAFSHLKAKFLVIAEEQRASEIKQIMHFHNMAFQQQQQQQQ